MRYSFGASLLVVPPNSLDFDELNKCYGFSAYATGKNSPERKKLKLDPLAESYHQIFDFTIQRYTKPNTSFEILSVMILPRQEDNGD